MNDKKQEIQDIVAMYANRYTAACFCDSMADEERYCTEANQWMLEQKAAHNITNEEIQEALEELEKKADAEGKPFGYSRSIME